MGPCSTDEARPHHSELGIRTDFSCRTRGSRCASALPTLGEGEHHEVAVQVRKAPFVSVNESYVRFSLLGDQSLVSGISEIDITMLAEKLSVGRKRNVKVEAWTVQCLAHSGEI